MIDIEEHKLTPTVLSAAAMKTNDLIDMSKHYQHPDGAYWPAFYLNWAADEMVKMEDILLQNVFKIAPDGLNGLRDDHPMHEIMRRACERHNKDVFTNAVSPNNLTP